MLIAGIATPEEWQREIAARDQRRPFDKSTAGGPIARGPSHAGQSTAQPGALYIPSRPVRRRDYHSSGNGRRRGSSPICSNRRSDRYVSKGQSPTTSFSQYRTRCITTPFPRRNVLAGEIIPNCSTEY